MSASRPILSPYQIVGGLEPGAVSGNMAASITSPVTIIQNLSQISYDVSWAGSSPVGLVTVQASNSYSQYADGSVDNPGDWNTLPLSATASVSGNTGSGVIDILASGLYAIRLVYTPVSGTGTMNVTITGKVA
jgi:hypothetical protein